MVSVCAMAWQQCLGRGYTELEGHCACAMAPNWDFPGCLQVCRDKCLAAWAEHEKEQAGVSCKVSTLWMPCGVFCERSGRNPLCNHVLQTSSRCEQSRFFEITWAKEQCQNKWEVLSILQSTSTSVSHPCWVPLAAACTQSLLSQLLRETLLILEVHGQKPAKRVFLPHFANPAFKISGNLLDCAGAVISAPAKQRLRWGKESLGAKGGLWMNIFPNIHQVLFYHSKIVNWHTSPPSTDMSQRHAKGLWQKVFLLGHLGSSAWEGIWLTLSTMPSARAIHFSFAICVILLLCTHSKWQTTCVFYLLKRTLNLSGSEIQD